MAQQLATRTLPPAVHQLAASHQLGAPAAEYRRWLRPWRIATSVVLTLPGFFFLYIGLVFTPESLLTPLIVALAFFGCALIWPLIFLVNIKHRVYVFAEGLVQAKGSRVDVLRWDQVESFVQNVTRTTNTFSGIPLSRVTIHVYTVRRVDGTKLVFRDSLRHVEGLGNTIARATAQRLLFRAIAAYSSGAPVAFGELTISQQGISKGQTLLPWNQFQNYQISNGTVLIRQQGKRLNWSSTPVRNVPNLLVFVALMDYIRRGQGQAPR